MGMMKSHLAALEGLVNLHHQRSAASPNILAYSERLQSLIRPGHTHPVQLCKRKTDETQVTMAVRKQGKRRRGVGVRGKKRVAEKTLSFWLSAGDLCSLQLCVL